MEWFDLNRKATFLILISILSVYVGLSFHEIYEPECTGLGDCYDYDRRMSRIAIWNVDWIQDDFRHSVHFLLIVLSEQLFNNAKFLVLVSSTVLLVLTYLLTLNLSGKRLAGVIAVVIVLSSNIFRTYDTSVTYPSFWTTIYIFTLYLLTTRFWFLSSLSYLSSIPAKAITALFIPATVCFIALSDCQTRRNRIKILIMYGVMIIGGFVALLTIGTLNSRLSGFYLITRFDFMDFVGGFVSWMWKGFASDQIILLFIFVFGFMVFMNRKVIRNSGAVLGLLAGMILISPILIGMTTYDVWAYRELPIVIVVGILGGMFIINVKSIDWTVIGLGKRTKASTSNDKEHP